MQLLRPAYPLGKTLISIIKENRVYFLEDDRQKKKKSQTPTNIYLPNKSKRVLLKADQGNR